MTGETRSIQRSDHDSARMRELLRADAAAAIDDDLDDDVLGETSELSTNESEGDRPGRPKSQVYSIRVPVERLEQVRQLAKGRGIAPTAMLREWVLAQLDVETGSTSDEALRPAASSSGQRASAGGWDATSSGPLEATVASLTAIAGQFTQALTLLMELVAAQSAMKPRPTIAVQAFPAMFHAPSSSLHSTPAGIASFWPTFQESVWLGHSSAAVVHRGLDELWVTVENVSGRTDLEDLPAMYLAVDEEMANP
ncbi:putative DNA-binding protein [Catenulispora sp. MAP5-51]|uniref:hypothetical protein n=1 Tax=Catenulispora sp. MAP5-51 TaxID=3156298 RepID=UPI003510E81C